VYELGPADRLVELWRLAPSQSNRINAVAVHDDLVFVLESDALRIFHEVPHEASELGAGALASWAGPGNLAVHGGRAYVGYNYMDWEWGLEVLDATDPTGPVSTGVVRGAGSVSGMTVDRDRGLLVSCGPDVYLTSLADPAGPLLVGTYDGTDRRSVDAALDDRIVITAAGGDGAHLVDVTDPAAPAAVAVIPSAGGADRVDWHGDTLLVDLGRNGVQILDAADPGGPAEVARLPAIPEGTSAWRTHLAADGIVLQSARVVTEPDGDQQVYGAIRSLDATDPAAPVVLDRVELDDVSATALADGLLLVATYRSLLVADVSDPASISVVGSVANGASYVTPMDRDLVLTVAGDGITNRLDVVDLSDPARPSVVGSLDLPDHTRITAVTPGPWSTVTVAVGAGTAASDRFVAVVDLADPSAPEILGRLTLGGEPTAMTGLRGERVAVAVESRWPSGGRALIVDVSDPTRLRVADSFTEVAWIRDLAARDGLLAVAAGDAGVTVWDVSGLLPTPHRPTPHRPPGAVD